ncbi:MAG: DNA gyrase inhibitor YacG [Rhodobacterales bacterium 32-66-7]|nr:MAG: DNA gyrase inhibitor YacG [Rhodobacterales bacterium 12-65-15]OYX23233.1 MAG: DNA gyrase inhibitor YacG [Rhodobacterales bacterium 32-66-7]
MKCPICGKPAVPDYLPFCSRRCADVDLFRWLTESYAIPVKPDETDEDEPERSDLRSDPRPDPRPDPKDA